MIKERSIAMCIILSIVTCGIYGIYWFVCLTDDVNNLNQSQGTSGVVAFLLSIVTCSIYYFYWAYKMGENIDNAKQQRGIPSSNLNILYLILCLFSLGIVAYALMQSELNKLANA